MTDTSDKPAPAAVWVGVGSVLAGFLVVEGVTNGIGVGTLIFGFVLAALVLISSLMFRRRRARSAGESE